VHEQLGQRVQEPDRPRSRGPAVAGHDRVGLALAAQPPEHVIKTDGMRGGTGYEPVAPPGPVVDAYGAGDTFVAGVLYGLAGGRPVAEAAALGARWAAETVTWRGAYP